MAHFDSELGENSEGDQSHALAFMFNHDEEDVMHVNFEKDPAKFRMPPDGQEKEKIEEESKGSQDELIGSVLHIPKEINLQDHKQITKQRNLDDVRNIVSNILNYEAELEDLLALVLKSGQTTQMLNHIEFIGTENKFVSIYFKMINQLYYKFDSNFLEKKNMEIVEGSVTSGDLMEKLCSNVLLRTDSDLMKCRTNLMHSYHHALHDNFWQAEILLSASDWKNNNNHFDDLTENLCYHTIARITLCAFRQGFFTEAVEYHGELSRLPKPSMLLGESLCPEIDELEMPTRIQIDSDCLNFVQLVSRMFLGKDFLIESPPEIGQSPLGQMYNLIMLAEKNLRKGNWALCADLIFSVGACKYFDDADSVKDMLRTCIKEESLRLFLLKSSCNSETSSLNVETLSIQFDLLLPNIESVLNQVNKSSGLIAYLDDSATNVVIMKREKFCKLFPIKPREENTAKSYKAPNFTHQTVVNQPKKYKKKPKKKAENLYIKVLTKNVANIKLKKL